MDVREMNYALDILGHVEVDDAGVYSCCGGRYEGDHLDGCDFACPYDDEDDDDYDEVG